ncbi:MAG: hypothetical protein IPH26_10765 [Sterolibacteriaceae bacterium]|uniref:Protein translocase subunit SecA n=1 Tax=Candidatus Methylophosphatis roskildensis TaxID=2899263 RepID=A0A9D7DYU9_9PROT|nr:hypothetical protein [Candidatus Methylophosphatis roskildensis]
MNQAAIHWSDLPIPGLACGAYPERRASPRANAIELPLACRLAWDRLRALDDRRRNASFVRCVHAELATLREMPAEAREADVVALRHALRREGLAARRAAQAIAHAALACEQTFGHGLYDTQIIAARIVLDNRLAEMATGEGKTLAVAVAAAAAALAGIPVHVITANDYLVARDAETLQAFYARLGLTVGAVTQPLEVAPRRAAYAQDITYCTAKELVFDYLRDGVSLERDPLRWRIRQIVGAGADLPVLRGLCMAIVDEADSILIDEARVPFVLSKPTGNAQQRDYLAQSLVLAAELRDCVHFLVDGGSKSVRLTAAGHAHLDQRTAALGALWHNRMHRDEAIVMALSALHLYRCERHYLVRDDKIVIIDETTGRVAPGRAWSRGLHQLIELKESCEPSAPLVTAAQITYQRFFPRFMRLGGVSGTLRESRAELSGLYGLSVRKVPLRRPSRRRVLPTRLFPDHASLWTAVAERAAGLQAAGRAVLIGTDSVADAHQLSERLTQAGLAHSVLSARQDGDEAGVVARAGEPGQITVATNMAGRGTDIPLGDGVAGRGGLHVLSCQLNASRRIDRQLAGRCARQGEPGSVETWLSSQTPLLQTSLRHMPAGWLLRLPGRVVRALAYLQQRSEERSQAIQRRRLMEHDRQTDRQLSFGGPVE